MIDLHFNNNTYPMPTLWEELTDNQFKQIVPYLLLSMNGKMSVQECRVMVAFVLTGLSPRRFNNEEDQARYSENMYRISQAVYFLFRIEYENKKAFTRLDKDVRSKLYRYLPEEIDEKTMPEVKWAKKQKFTVTPDLVFAKNLLPKIGKRSKKLTGYMFDLNGQLLDCSLSFIQLVDAQRLSNQYFQSPTERMLNRFIATLYYPGKYDPENVQNIQVPAVDALTKQAVLFNFNAVNAFLYTRTKYSILFDDSDNDTKTTKKKKSSGLGLIGVNYSLMKSGFPDQKHAPVLEVFDIMYNELVTSVQGLFNDGKTIDEIADITKLSLAKINKILK